MNYFAGALFQKGKGAEKLLNMTMEKNLKVTKNQLWLQKCLQEVSETELDFVMKIKFI